MKFSYIRLDFPTLVRRWKQILCVVRCKQTRGSSKDHMATFSRHNSALSLQTKKKTIMTHPQFFLWIWPRTKEAHTSGICGTPLVTTYGRPADAKRNGYDIGTFRLKVLQKKARRWESYGGYEENKSRDPERATSRNGHTTLGTPRSSQTIIMRAVQAKVAFALAS